MTRHKLTEHDTMLAALWAEESLAILKRRLVSTPLHPSRIERALLNIDVLVRRELEALLCGE